MTALISLFIAIILSILVTRIATVAFTLTGLSREVAQFQALSAFTGVGFTTAEHEDTISQLSQRLQGRSGDEAHRQAKSEQDRRLKQQRAQDEAYSDYSSES